MTSGQTKRLGVVGAHVQEPSAGAPVASSTAASTQAAPNGAAAPPAAPAGSSLPAQQPAGQVRYDEPFNLSTPDGIESLGEMFRSIANAPRGLQPDDPSGWDGKDLLAGLEETNPGEVQPPANPVMIMTSPGADAFGGAAPVPVAPQPQRPSLAPPSSHPRSGPIPSTAPTILNGHGFARQARNRRNIALVGAGIGVVALALTAVGVYVIAKPSTNSGTRALSASSSAAASPVTPLSARSPAAPASAPSAAAVGDPDPPSSSAPPATTSVPSAGAPPGARVGHPPPQKIVPGPAKSVAQPPPSPIKPAGSGTYRKPE